MLMSCCTAYMSTFIQQQLISVRQPLSFPFDDGHDRDKDNVILALQQMNEMLEHKTVDEVEQDCSVIVPSQHWLVLFRDLGSLSTRLP